MDNTRRAAVDWSYAGLAPLVAPVQRYLPWFRVADPQASAQITVRHLLNQTSGLPQLSGLLLLADFDDRPDAAERQARALATYELARPVGSAFEYSNVNYNLLGLIIEAASGESYPNYVKHHIFDPLEMSHSYTSKAAAKQDGLAVGHRSWFVTPVAVPDLPMVRGSLPAGQLISSAEDMAHYLIAHLSQGQYKDAQILSPEGIAELHRPAAEAMAMGFDMGDYGMGWFIEETGQGTRISHNGTCPDFFAYMALLPGQKRGMVLLVNVNQMMINFALDEVAQGVATLLAGRQPAPIQFGFIPWALRGLLLIPVLQIAGVVATLRLLRRWRQDPEHRPGPARKRVFHLLFPMVLNLIPVAGGLALLGSSLRGFLLLFMPDLSWLALISGGFALVWSFLRTGLVLRALRKASSPQSFAGRLGAEPGVFMP